MKALAHFLITLAGQHQGQEDIILKAECIQQVKILKHKAKVVSSECGDFFFLYSRKAPAIQQDLAARGLIKCRQDVKQCSLSGSGFAHDRHILTLFHRKGHIRQGLDLISSKSCCIDFLKAFRL